MIGELPLNRGKAGGGHIVSLFGKFVVAILSISCCAWSRGLLGFGVSGGLKGGVPLTDALTDTTWPVSFPGVATRTFSNSRNFIIGPMLELNLPLGLSVEGDGLYRSVNISARSGTGEWFAPGLSSTTYGFWEVSVLAKYHAPLPFVKPYLAAGPSFRTVDSLNGYFSTRGVTGALGVELKLLKLRVGPELRYTHWGNDPATAAAVAGQSLRTNRNQVEFLVGLSF
jgi:hypothetical protein